jgi:hypothetical protein
LRVLHHFDVLDDHVAKFDDLHIVVVESRVDFSRALGSE